MGGLRRLAIANVLWDSVVLDMMSKMMLPIQKIMLHNYCECVFVRMCECVCVCMCVVLLNKTFLFSVRILYIAFSVQRSWDNLVILLVLLDL